MTGCRVVFLTQEAHNLSQAISAQFDEWTKSKALLLSQAPEMAGA
jgi:hypothetical protein